MRERAAWPLVAGGQLTVLLTFLSVCWNFELTSRWLLSKREDSQAPPNPRSLRFLLTQELSRLLLTTSPKEQTLLPYGLFAYPRSSPTFPSAIPFISNQCKFFQSNLHLSPPTWCIKMLTNSRMADMLSFLPGTEACGLGFTHQNLVLFFLASNGPINPFF